jgi:hypothetical protein
VAAAGLLLTLAVYAKIKIHVAFIHFMQNVLFSKITGAIAADYSTTLLSFNE